MKQQQITDDLFSLMNVLPAEIAEVMKIGRNDDLVVILDSGVPTARYTDGEAAA